MNTRVICVLLAACLLGCPPANPGPEDAGVEEEVPFEGDGTTGLIPEVSPPPAGIEPVDAGEFSTDTRCCNLVFSIDDQEPADVRGAVVGSFGPLEVDGGLPLTRRDGGWEAAACFPLGASTQYTYRFWRWAPSDGGEGSDDGGANDGGSWVETVRFSTTEANLPDGLGGNVNLIPSVTDCGALDASVGTR